MVVIFITLPPDKTVWHKYRGKWLDGLVIGILSMEKDVLIWTIWFEDSYRSKRYKCWIKKHRRPWILHIKGSGWKNRSTKSWYQTDGAPQSRIQESSADLQCIGILMTKKIMFSSCVLRTGDWETKKQKLSGLVGPRKSISFWALSWRTRNLSRWEPWEENHTGSIGNQTAL